MTTKIYDAKHFDKGLEIKDSFDRPLKFLRESLCVSYLDFVDIVDGMVELYWLLALLGAAVLLVVGNRWLSPWAGRLVVRVLGGRSRMGGGRCHVALACCLLHEQNETI